MALLELEKLYRDLTNPNCRYCSPVDPLQLYTGAQNCAIEQAGCSSLLGIGTRHITLATVASSLFTVISVSFYKYLQLARLELANVR